MDGDLNSETLMGKPPVADKFYPNNHLQQVQQPDMRTNETRPMVMMVDRETGRQYLAPAVGAFDAEWRRGSMTGSVSGAQMADDQDFDVKPQTMRKRSSSLPRKNTSLQDVRGQFDPLMLPHPYAFPPPAYLFGPYGPYGPQPNPWEAQSMDMDYEISSEEEEEDEDAASFQAPPPSVSARVTNNQRSTGSVNRRSRKDSTLRSMRGTMPRSLSSFQLPMAGWGPPGSMPPPAYYPPFHPQYGFYGAPSFYGQPSYTSSPPGSMQSLSMRRKKSLDMLSTASSTMRHGHRDRQQSHGSHSGRRRESLERLDGYGAARHHHRHKRGGSKQNSVVSSRYESETEYSDEEEEEEEEEEDFSVSELSLAAAPVPISDDPTKPWSCKYCTYVNEPVKEVCEICSKSKPKRHEKKSNAKSKQKKNDEMEGNEDLIREQLEIEREMKRRLENEKRVAEHNRKIEEREKQLKEKNENYNPDEDLDLVIEPEEPEDEEKEVMEAMAKSTKEHRRRKPRSTAASDVSSVGRSTVGSTARRRRKGSREEMKSLASSLSSLSVTRKKKKQTRRDKSDDEDEEEEQEDADRQTLETLISSLEKQKLEIQKIEEIISATQAQVNSSAKSSNETKADPPKIAEPPNVPTAIQSSIMSPQVSCPTPSLAFQPVQNPYMPMFTPQPAFQQQYYDPMMQMINPYGPQLRQPQMMANMRPFQGSSENLRNMGAPFAPQSRFRDDRSFVGSRCGSREDLLNPYNCSASSSTGMEMIRLLRDAERKGFTADDVEVALHCSPTEPLEWLEENWSNMVETVLRLANNQIIQNETKKGKIKGRISENSLVREKDAKFCLRKTKGNVWTAVEKCIQRKEEERMNSSKSPKEKSFTLEFNEPGNGRDNMEINEVIVYTPDENEIVDMFIAKWKQEKEDEEVFQDALEEGEDRRLFELDDDDDDGQTSEHDIKSVSAKDRFFTSFDQLQEAATESGNRKSSSSGSRDLRKYLLNKYFGSQDEDSQRDQQTNTTDHIKDINEPNTEREEDEGEKIANTEESRRAFFQGKNLEEYVADQDASVEIEGEPIAGPSNQSPIRKIDTNLGNNFDFLMSLKVDGLSPDETIKSLMRAGSKSDDEESDEELKEIMLKSDKDVMKCVTTLLLKPEYGVMSRSESPRFMAEPDQKGKIKIISKKTSSPSKRKRGIDFSGSDSTVSSREVSPRPDSSKSYPNLIQLGDARSFFECELCAAIDVPVEKMITMLACEHSACDECMCQYLSLQIRERQAIVIPCPFCKEPELSPNDEDAVCDYISMMDQLIRTLLPDEIHSLFQRKVRDRALAKDPSFRWCPNCSSGFIAANLCASTVMCPDCKKVLCINCNKIVSVHVFTVSKVNHRIRTVGTTACGNYL